MTPPATAPLVALPAGYRPAVHPAELITTELYQAPTLASAWLAALLFVDARVTSRRWLERQASPDGSVHYFPDGPVMRVRTEQLTPVPERTTP